MLLKDLDHAASGQFGLVTTGQLREIGLTPRQIDRRIATGALIRVRYKVYRVAGSPVQWEQSPLSAVLATRVASVISHQTAAAVWQLKYSDRHTAGIHVTAGRPVYLKGVTSHVAPITPDECTTRESIPITTRERTIIDLAEVLGELRLGRCVDDALRRGVIHLEPLRALVASAPSSLDDQRNDPLRQVLADRAAGYRPDDSDLETRMNAEWVRLGLPQAQRQYRVRCGNKTYRVDVALPDTKIGIEWDSLAFHGTRSGMDADSDRRADLTTEGWAILSFTWNSRPERMARAVLRVWRDRGGHRAPSEVPAAVGAVETPGRVAVVG